MFDYLGLNDKTSDKIPPSVRLTLKSLPKLTFVRFKPKTFRFSKISNPKSRYVSESSTYKEFQLLDFLVPTVPACEFQVSTWWPKGQMEGVVGHPRICPRQTLGRVSRNVTDRGAAARPSATPAAPPLSHPAPAAPWDTNARNYKLSVACCTNSQFFRGAAHKSMENNQITLDSN